MTVIVVVIGTVTVVGPRVTVAASQLDGVPPVGVTTTVTVEGAGHVGGGLDEGSTDEDPADEDPDEDPDEASDEGSDDGSDEPSVDETSLTVLGGDVIVGELVIRLVLVDASVVVVPGPMKQEHALLARTIWVLPAPQLLTKVGNGPQPAVGLASRDEQKLDAALARCVARMARRQLSAWHTDLPSSRSALRKGMGSAYTGPEATPVRRQPSVASHDTVDDIRIFLGVDARSEDRTEKGPTRGGYVTLHPSPVLLIPPSRTWQRRKEAIPRPRTDGYGLASPGVTASLLFSPAGFSASAHMWRSGRPMPLVDRSSLPNCTASAMHGHCNIVDFSPKGAASGGRGSAK